MPQYLVLADIHGNLEALQAVFAHAIEQHGRPDEIWCLGDIVGYGPDPGACIDLLREPVGFDNQIPVRCVRGNHDDGVLMFHRREQPQQSSQDIANSWLWTSQLLTADQFGFLDQLPRYLALDDLPLPTLLVHGAPPDNLEQYLHTASDVEAHLQTLHQRVCLFGHTHLACYFEANSAQGEARPRLFSRGRPPVAIKADKIFMNPGTVGQPRWGRLVNWEPGDNPTAYPRKLAGEAGATYLWLDMRSDGLLVSCHIVRYEVERTVQKLRDLANQSPALVVPDRYMVRLREGLR